MLQNILFVFVDMNREVGDEGDPCDNKCDSNARCVAGRCVCASGYAGDGHICQPDGTPLFKEDKQYKGNGLFDNYVTRKVHSFIGSVTHWLETPLDWRSRQSRWYYGSYPNYQYLGQNYNSTCSYFFIFGTNSSADDNTPFAYYPTIPSLILNFRKY